MKITAVLANHVEVHNNLLYVSGGGFNRIFVTQDAPPPWGADLSIGFLVTVPWTQANDNHVLDVRLIDADGRPFQVPTNSGFVPLRIQADFRVGTPEPSNDPTDERTIALQVAIPGLPFYKFGWYRFDIYVNNAKLEEIAFKVARQKRNSIL